MTYGNIVLKRQPCAAFSLPGHWQHQAASGRGLSSTPLCTHNGAGCSKHFFFHPIPVPSDFFLALTGNDGFFFSPLSISFILTRRGLHLIVYLN